MDGVPGEIAEFLGPRRGDLVAQSLAYGGSRFRCPGCGRYGDGDAGVVLYFDVAMAGGFSGETSDAGSVPDEPTMVRWWLARTHARCALSPLMSWPQVPGWAVPTDRSFRALDPLAGETTWSVSVGPAGLPLLRCRPAAPVCQVVANPRSVNHPERLVDLVTSEMCTRGAFQLRNSDLLADTTGESISLTDWYAQLSDDAITMWMSPSITAGFAPGADREQVRRQLAVVSGLPKLWLDAVREQGRLLLEMTGPPIIHRDALSAAWYQETPRAGGVVAVGSVVDADRCSVSRKPKRQVRVVRDINVDELWEPALARARMLTTVHNEQLEFKPHADAEMIAIVVVGLCRQDGDLPQDVTLAALAERLIDRVNDLHAWLTMMIEPTNMKDRLSRLRDRAVTPMGESRWMFSRHETVAAVDRQRLVDAGGIRFGDRVLVLPELGEPDPAAWSGRIRQVNHAFEPRPGTHNGSADAYLTCDTEEAVRQVHVAEHNVLLANDRDPRAVEQAAYCAGIDLWTHLDVLPHYSDSPFLDVPLRRRYAIHGPGPVRDLLERLRDVPEYRFSEVVAETLEQLMVLAPRHAFPGGILGPRP